MDDLELSRRRLLAAAGLTGAAAALGAEAGPARAQPSGAPAAAPAVAGLHLQFGADAAAEMTVSWHTLTPVERPRVLVGTTEGRLQRTVAAGTESYVDAKSKRTVYAHHARIGGLKADTAYLYGALHEGAEA